MFVRPIGMTGSPSGSPTRRRITGSPAGQPGTQLDIVLSDTNPDPGDTINFTVTVGGEAYTLQNPVYAWKLDGVVDGALASYSVDPATDYGSDVGKQVVLTITDDNYTGTSDATQPIGLPNVLVGDSDFAVTEDGSYSGQLVARSPVGNALTFSKASNPTNGTVQVFADGTFNYWPNPGEQPASDSFQFDVTDGINPDPATTTVTVTITEVDQPPTLTVDPLDLGATFADVTLLIPYATFTDNATDPDGTGTITLIDVSVKFGSGTITDNTTTGWVYDHNGQDFYGTIPIEYVIADAVSGGLETTGQATILVNEPNVDTAPVGTDFIFLPIRNNETLDVTAAELISLSAAYDAQADPISVNSFTKFSGAGTLTDNLDDTWTFDPAVGQDEQVVFHLVLEDDNANTSSTVTATLDVLPKAADIVVLYNEGAVDGVDLDDVTYPSTTVRASAAPTKDYDGSMPDVPPDQLRLYGGRTETNLIPSPATYAGSTITVEAGQQYTYSFTGAETATFSGAYVGTFTGAAGTRRGVTFTTTGTSLTISTNSVTNAQLQKGDVSEFVTGTVTLFSTNVYGLDNGDVVDNGGTGAPTTRNHDAYNLIPWDDRYASGFMSAGASFTIGQTLVAGHYVLSFKGDTTGGAVLVESEDRQWICACGDNGLYGFPLNLPTDSDLEITHLNGGIEEIRLDSRVGTGFTGFSKYLPDLFTDMDGSFQDTPYPLDWNPDTNALTPSGTFGAPFPAGAFIEESVDTHSLAGITLPQTEGSLVMSFSPAFDRGQKTDTALLNWQTADGASILYLDSAGYLASTDGTNTAVNGLEYSSGDTVKVGVTWKTAGNINVYAAIV